MRVFLQYCSVLSGHIIPSAAAAGNLLLLRTPEQRPLWFSTPSKPSQAPAQPCRQPSDATAAIYCTVLKSLVTILSARAERKQSLPHCSTDFKKKNSPKSCLNRSVFLPATSAAPKQAITVACIWHLPVYLDLTRLL